MPQRFVKETVILHRPDEKGGGKTVRVVPEIGKNFNFTAEEISEIEEVRKEALGKAVAKDDGDDAAPKAAAPKAADAKATDAKAKEDEL